MRTLPGSDKAAESFLKKHILTCMVESPDLSRRALDVVVGDVALTSQGISMEESEGMMGITDCNTK